MAKLIALHTSHEWLTFLRIPALIFWLVTIETPCPHFKTTSFSMSSLITLIAETNVFLVALTCFVSNLIAFKTHFFCALKRVVRVLATKDAVKSQSLVWTVPAYMSKLTAVSALYRNIIVLIITCNLLF